MVGRIVPLKYFKGDLQNHHYFYLRPLMKRFA